ncbi:hypothetical protein MKW92_028125 [Papaver armeniacum]|nr:hypothetical protein MKW92_028125 [Papaver armeniacum]
MAMVGNVGDSSKRSEISVDLAKFAVDEYNKKENAVLEFVRVVKAKEHVVVGAAARHLTLELQEFKHSDQESSSASNSTPSDLGFKREEGHAPGLKAVPADDPAVKDAADHAVESINQRSNSLTPHAEVIEDAVKFHMLLKVKWGSQEEKYVMGTNIFVESEAYSRK